ncbi:MAG: PilZ domain-containing protein [Nitrospira sp.]|nr:PilZ domain-containing protein [Nitrospira sp.]
MSSDAPASQPSGRDRREYYRITVTLPIRIQLETDTAERALVEQSVNLSGGGFGVTISVLYRPADLLAITFLLPDHGLFTSFAEVLRLDPVPYHEGTYRLHARFVRMPSQDREVLIKHILQFQRDHLHTHYSA